MVVVLTEVEDADVALGGGDDEKGSLSCHIHSCDRDEDSNQPPPHPY